MHTRILLLQAERYFALLDSAVQAFEETVGEVQREEPMLETLDELEDTARSIVKHGQAVSKELEVLQYMIQRSGIDFEKKRILLLDQKMDEVIGRFWRSSHTLQDFLHILNEGLN